MYRHIPKDVIEEALSINISDNDFQTISSIFTDSNSLTTTHTLQAESTPETVSTPQAPRGLDAIVSAAQQLESSSLRLPSLSQQSSLGMGPA